MTRNEGHTTIELSNPTRHDWDNITGHKENTKRSSWTQPTSNKGSRKNLDHNWDIEETLESRMRTQEQLIRTTRARWCESKRMCDSILNTSPKGRRRTSKHTAFCLKIDNNANRFDAIHLENCCKVEIDTEWSESVESKQCLCQHFGWWAIGGHLLQTYPASAGLRSSSLLQWSRASLAYLCPSDALRHGCKNGCDTTKHELHQPGIEPGSHRWERCILPQNHWCLKASSVQSKDVHRV